MRGRVGASALCVTNLTLPRDFGVVASLYEIREAHEPHNVKLVTAICDPKVAIDPIEAETKPGELAAVV